MRLVDRFTERWPEQLAVAGPEALPTALARAAVDVLPFDGAGLSVMSGPLRLPLGSSDEASATAERLQFSVGEGPCWQAHREGRPVVTTAESMAANWPVLHDQHRRRTSFRAGLSVPVSVGDAALGVLDLYRVEERVPQPSDVHDAVVVAAVTAEVLFEALPDVDNPRSGSSWLDRAPARDRRQVWVAVGMVNLVLGLDSPAALALLRARAFADDRTLDALAHDLVTGQVLVEDLDDTRPSDS
ncbi:GAF domain-containing protein [Kineococcus sp. R8]|uniref:GAF domain-containing protein n=1 Tax=Kineococcus siccus TaxID=2696567 RepID=UPI0014126EF0|nr:GAF domain-containing protein [Kineococcus siccus]NAZ84249.1 GAF domain-containing protein [Kineococcus siccus]